MVYSIRDLESAIFVAGDLLVGGFVPWLQLLLNTHRRPFLLHSGIQLIFDNR